MQPNSEEPGHTPRLVAHDLGLHDLCMSHKRNARLVVVLYIWYSAYIFGPLQLSLLRILGSGWGGLVFTIH